MYMSMDFPGKNTVYLSIYIYIYTYIYTHYFHEFHGKLCMFCFSNSVSQTKQVKGWK